MLRDPVHVITDSEEVDLLVRILFFEIFNSGQKVSFAGRFLKIHYLFGGIIIDYLKYRPS